MCKKMYKSRTASERISSTHQQVENGGCSTSLDTQMSIRSTFTTERPIEAQVRFLPVARGDGIFIFAAHRGAGVQATTDGKSHDIGAKILQRICKQN